MAFLKFNKSELVNLSYSLKREVICANKTGAYSNTSILSCNTRRYHGLLAVTLDRFGGERYLLLSDLDESLNIDSKQFNLAIHRYGDIYEPRGHKYIVDFSADPIPTITYKVGEILFRKSLMLAYGKDQVMVKYELLQAPSSVKFSLRPYLAFRNTHALTHCNPNLQSELFRLDGGVAYCLYPQFPMLYMQMSEARSRFVSDPYWNMGITYSDEARRGFECKEDLWVPGYFETELKQGESVVFSASITEENASALNAAYDEEAKRAKEVGGCADQLRHCADSLITRHNGRSRISAGFSWLKIGLLRETLLALPGLALHGLNNKKLFEEILDNLISDEQERLLHKTTQVEAPLLLANVLQAYIEYGANEQKLWGKYGATLRSVLESYLPGHRAEVAMQPNGLLWAQKDRVALSWMNAYIDGYPVTERAGYQVETNAYWYNAICFALEMEARCHKRRLPFVDQFEQIKALIEGSYRDTFWNERFSCLADYVDNGGQHLEIRPNQLCAIACQYSPIGEEEAQAILRVVARELVTSRGIRTLSPRDDKYKSVYEGSQTERDLAYHQGCTRPYLLEPYILTSLKYYGASFIKKAEWLIEGFYEDLSKHGVGAFSELYDGDPPHEAHGAISSSLSTAALLTIESAIKKYKEL